MKALHFGAGNIGRGFIGKLLADAGIQLTFADVNQVVLDALNARHSYQVHVVGETEQVDTVSGVNAVSSIGDDVVDLIAQVDLVTTAVGQNVMISVTNSAINNLPPDVDLVITHRDLTERAMRQVPQAQHISLTNFLDSGLYTSLTERLVAAQRHTANEEKVKDSLKDSFDDSSANLFKLGAENIFLGRKAATKEEAIRFAGEQLVKGGYVEPEYVQAMLDREKLTPTYLGESIAVPHGTVEAKDRVLKTGVVFCQYPEGVRFGEEEDDIARLVIGIAARNNEHIQVITSLTNALDDESVIERLAHTTSVDEVLELLAGRK